MLISKFKIENIENMISEFETKYEFKFPNQYHEFLLKYGGGQTPKTEFKIGKTSSDLHCFYGFITNDEWSNYEKFDRIVSFEEFLNDSMLPIGDTDFGDYIMIGIGKENNGKIFFYYNDRPKKYIELTEDFKTFVSKCKSKKVGHIRTIEERKADMVKLGKAEKITPLRLSSWQEEIDWYANIHQVELILS